MEKRAEKYARENMTRIPKHLRGPRKKNDYDLHDQEGKIVIVNGIKNAT